MFGENVSVMGGKGRKKGKRQAKHIECPSKPPWNSPHDFDETTATLTTTVTVLQSPSIVTVLLIVFCLRSLIDFGFNYCRLQYFPKLCVKNIWWFGKWFLLFWWQREQRFVSLMFIILVPKLLIWDGSNVFALNWRLRLCLVLDMLLIIFLLLYCMCHLYLPYKGVSIQFGWMSTLWIRLYVLDKRLLNIFLLEWWPVAFLSIRIWTHFRQWWNRVSSIHYYIRHVKCKEPSIWDSACQDQEQAC